MLTATYFRKRSKKPATSLTIMGAEQGSVSGTVHNVQQKVGCIYEIDHLHLPARTPVQLQSIRVAMVCETTDVNVSIRYPNMESLRAFLGFSKRETHPTLEEKFVMGTSLADKVLYRMVPGEVFVMNKGLESFWLRSSSNSDSDAAESLNDKKCGFLFDELKGDGMMRWGARRQVKYLGKHKDQQGHDGLVQNPVSSSFNGVDEDVYQTAQELVEEEIGDEDILEEEDQEEEEEEDKVEVEVEEEKEEEEEDEEEEKVERTNKNLKRKRYAFRNLSKKKPKKEQKPEKKTNKKKKNKGRARYKEAIVVRNPKDRWSSERYKQAKQNLLEVMNTKKATAEKPLLRPQLRAEARKSIGDTGLLDHLLKHMADKVAPGGDMRFRRRHNADGAMEYWLENAEFQKIRKEAGVADPYWVPPPGWKLGDSPNQDPICARELRLLKDEIEMLKSNVELVATKELLEKEVEKLRREVDKLVSIKKQEESQLTTITTSSQLATSLISSKRYLEKTPTTLEEDKELLLVNSVTGKEIQANGAKLNSTLIAPNETLAGGQEKQQVQAQAIYAAASEHDTLKLAKHQTKAQTAEIPEAENYTAEQKAAKIQRLKSGFRICKPQGTFLWPADMVKHNISVVNPGGSNSMVTVQVDVPTPPSVSSLAPPQLPWHHYLPPASPVKPRPEKRAVSVTVSTTTTPAINLNDAPMDHSMPLVSPTANTGLWENTGLGQTDVVVGYNDQNKACCSSSSVSSFPWLALSTSKSASNESDRD